MGIKSVAVFSDADYNAVNILYCSFLVLLVFELQPYISTRFFSSIKYRVSVRFGTCYQYLNTWFFQVSASFLQDIKKLFLIYLDSLFIANSILYLFDKCIFKIIKIKNSIIDIMADQIPVYIANDSEWQQTEIRQNL